MDEIFGNIEVRKNEPLNLHTTFKIGGPATFFLLPKNIKELKKILEICKKRNMRYFLIGNGSNLLIDDDGFNGAVISLAYFNHIKIVKNKDLESVYVESGVSLFELNKFLANNGFSGLEWSYGIPGKLGGVIKMNAGAFEHSIFDFLEEITVLKNGKIKKLKKLKSAYRNSYFTDEIVISAILKLKRGNTNDIFDKMNNYFNQKKETQPYNFPSAGSVFKRKNNVIPSKFIDEKGFKGLRIGDAMISTKHAGFIINLGNASSNDVKKLITIVKSLCNDIELEEEIIYLK